MATLSQRVTDLATRIATEFKAVRASMAAINDGVTNGTSVWSSSKTSSEITTKLASLTNGAPAALDQLNELAAALGNDANFAATTATALANRVRFDAAQTLTAPQKAQAKSNIDAYGALEIGNPDTDFVATFNAGLL